MCQHCFPSSADNADNNTQESYSLLFYIRSRGMQYAPADSTRQAWVSRIQVVSGSISSSYVILDKSNRSNGSY